MSRKLRSTVAVPSLAVLTAVALLSGCASPAPSSTRSPADDKAAASAPADLPQGTKGAAHFDDLALVVGDGPIDVLVWIDPRCPDCQAFETSAGDEVADLVADGEITYSIHRMNFLDRASAGSAYSTRAGSALTCVAVEQPDLLLDAVAALFAAQPEEGTAGLSDEELNDTLADAGVEGMKGCIDEGSYASWVQYSNDSALAGIEGADITEITGTPTLIVDGVSFSGDITDTAAVRDFIVGSGRG